MSLGSVIARGVMLGGGLAMDAFSVSLVNGMREPGMSRGKHIRIAATFALFQTAMPLIGWLLVRTVIQAFHALQPLIPWIAFALLGYIGGKMILEGLKKEEEERAEEEVGMGSLLAQGLATSIDALQRRPGPAGGGHHRAGYLRHLLCRRSDRAQGRGSAGGPGFRVRRRPAGADRRGDSGFPLPVTGRLKSA